MTTKKIISIVPCIIISIAIINSCASKPINKSTSGKQQITSRTPETENLLKNLITLSEKGFMFGHQDDPMYGIGWNGDADRSDVKSVAGDYPAVMGLDLSKIEIVKTDNIDGVPFNRIGEEIIKQYNRGGIITISWHMNNPLTDGDSWDVKTPGVVKAVINDPKIHNKFMGWLKKGSQFLKTLKAADGTKIPIIFRPWHEHTGSWFWWGQNNCTKEEYVQLWKITRKYFEKEGLNNLLWAYSPDFQGKNESYKERYPGDEYVDVLGFDTYHFLPGNGTERYVNVMNASLTQLTTLGKEKNKPIAVTETGLESLPIADWWTNILYPILEKYPVSYVLVWRNAHDKANHFYAPYPGQKSAEDFVKFYNLPKTLFCKDIPNMYK